MKAWRVHTNGEPRDVMRLEDIPDPEPGPGEVLVRVRAAGVNFPDALMCRGEYQVKPPFPFTPGVELCGDVLAVGEGVPEAGAPEAGSRVIAQPALPMGGFAEKTLVSAAGVRKAPEALDDAEAAALHIGYQTGWFGLHRRARLQPGETLLVHAAADVVVDRREDDIVAAVKDATGGRGADVVYDPVGGDAYAKSVKCIAFEGRIVIVGFASGAVPTPGLNHALIKNYSILGLHWGLYNTKDPAAVQACHEELTALAADGAVKPLISERLPLEDGASAVQRVFDGITTGRVVIQP